jgi:hypothetical protein
LVVSELSQGPVKRSLIRLPDFQALAALQIGDLAATIARCLWATDPLLPALDLINAWALSTRPGSTVSP